MRIGVVCPYSFDHPGGVQIHIMDLAREMRGQGHEVFILAPGERGTEPDEFTTLVGKGVPIPYNGSVARLSFGYPTWRATKRWIADIEPDVLHIHEPNAPSTSMFALAIAKGPIVATFHTSTASSLVLKTFEGVLSPFLEKIRGRIAVSDVARRWQVQALGSDAVEIPNGVDVSFYKAARDKVSTERNPRDDDGEPHPPAVTFLGRFDEPRKGLGVLLRAWRTVRERIPDAELWVMGGGDKDEALALLGDTGGVRFLGRVDDEEKARTLAEADVYCAPNTGGESFGIVLVEAMAAGTAVLASDLDAFRRVLRDGECGQLFATGRSESLAEHLVALLEEDARRADLVARAAEAVEGYDWPVVCTRVLRVYETVRAPGEKVRVSEGARFRDVARANPSGGRGRGEGGER